MICMFDGKKMLKDKRKFKTNICHLICLLVCAFSKGQGWNVLGQVQWNFSLINQNGAKCFAKMEFVC